MNRLVKGHGWQAGSLSTRRPLDKSVQGMDQLGSIPEAGG